ncbi:unnamed protein product [Periconia digitata]|uniref:Protein Zds1 C-terminal domain-containing protein n=1 Tax=Periconia digitata TaxID=1303443 RepID=A0A9W4U9G0_9PLEO|nr:unnamed protein product [Periconia digitata]
MQASERARELERVYQQRRGHGSHISISDDNHHVTEAIQDLYGRDDDYNMKRNSRPLSFITSPLGDSLESAFQPFDPFPNAPPKSPLRAQMSHSPKDAPRSPTSPTSPKERPTMLNRRTSSNQSNMNGGLASPPLSRTNSDTASQQFPLNDLDYESSAAGLAQELSNLQAIRRMSMDVNTADPDLPSFKSYGSATVPPQHFSEDEDPSKLFWVPARLHPELAPKEFKTFIEEKVDTIRRRSGDSDTLSPDGALGRQASGGGLRRKKSMLSRQIDNGSGYRDGADRLERQRSDAHGENGPLPQLQELENIVEDPASLVRRMSVDTTKRSSVTDGEGDEDVPILPGKVAGLGTLKRSTRTNYRRGSIRGKERVPFSRRAAMANAQNLGEDDQSAPGPPRKESEFTLERVQSEPPENFSRPTRKRSPPLMSAKYGSSDDVSRMESPEPPVEEQRRPQQKPFHSRIASNGRTTAPLPGYVPPPSVPQIVETPPPPEKLRKAPLQLPERNSSRQAAPNAQPPQIQPQASSQPNGPRQPPPQQQRPGSSGRLNRHAQASQASPIQPAQSFDDLIGQPNALPVNSNRVDSLTIIPSMDEKKSEKKSKDKKDSEGGSRKTSWGWLRGSDDKERDKKDKEEREKEMAKKVKNKLSKTQEKPHDDTRLDVLQHAGRGRESVVLDRESVKLEEERRKESSRKSGTPEGKKEKESGLFSSIFGGSKKKSEKESSHKKGNSMRGLSPEPPPRILKPDIDYNWTRFSILEERAIYRMAHIKLANPRRELYSQVLLSNFMYSYLAKVQQMHPQISIGNSAQAKQHQRQAAQQKKEQQQAQQQQQQQAQQPDEFTQYQRYQQQQHEQQSDGQGGYANNQYQQGNGSSESLNDDNHYQQQQQQQYSNNQRDPRDSHHSNYGNNPNNGYSVANSQSYMGQQKDSRGYYDDSDRSDRDDDMW